MSVCEECPRLIWTLCRDAFTEINLLRAEFVFTMSDTCERMLFVAAGELSYSLGCITIGGDVVDMPKRDWRHDQHGFDTTEQGPWGTDPVKPGQWLSEAVLWMSSWSHKGELRAENDCALLTLRGEALAKAVTAHPQKWAWFEVHQWACNFVKLLNMKRYVVSDLMAPDFYKELAPDLPRQLERKRSTRRSFTSFLSSS